MRDWELFAEQAPWFAASGDVVVGETGGWSRGPIASLPRLSTVLTAASVTPVSVSGKGYELLAWGPSDQRRGWLCEPPAEDTADVHPVHRSFWSACGGIVERFGEPPSWWLNQDEVLTGSAAATPVAEMIDAYRWLWDDDGLTVPVDPADYYAVAVEANGNLTLAHRVDGRLLLFAPDHAFDGVTPLAGCPPYSLMTIDEVPDLSTWIEVCAAAWSG